MGDDQSPGLHGVAVGSVTGAGPPFQHSQAVSVPCNRFPSENDAHSPQVDNVSIPDMGFVQGWAETALP